MKVIQVGIGGMGNAWLKAVQASDVVDYAGFVEINDAIAVEQAAKYDLDAATIYKSVPAALAALQPDGIIDVTPPQFHQDVSVTALEAGIPVLSEKPLADTLERAQRIVDKANETRMLHMVTQNYRYRPPVQTVKQVLASGELGAITSVGVQFYKGPHFGGFREEMAYPLIIDMSIHHLDMMRFFLERDLVSVYGRSWNPPWSWFAGDASALVTYQFDGDVLVTYDGSWCSNGADTSWNGTWRFECEHGSLHMEDDRVYVTQRDGDGKQRREVEQVTMQHTDQAYLLHEFYEAVTQGKTPATTCQDNIKSLAMVFNTVESFETGQLILNERT